VKKFLVQLEDRGFTFDVTIEAETIEQAVVIAREKHSQPRQVTVNPRPTWVEPYRDGMEDGEEIYELTHEIEGECSECKLVFLSNHKPDPSWPWNYASGDDRGYTNICYGCAQKRKEKGDFCPLFENYHRNSPTCEDCPAGECPKARDRHFQKLREVLTNALFAQGSRPGNYNEIREFILNNEFGLAYDALKTLSDAGPHTLPVSGVDLRIREALDSARRLMDKGWK
jgi:hypothetical protein